MNRQSFLGALRAGLSGLAPATVDEIVADYAAHFTEGEAAGRSDAEVAQALGEPGRLARELRAEAGLKRWEQERTPNAAAGAIFAVLGLVTLDILILLPVLMALGGTLFGLFVAAIGVFFAGGWVFVAGLIGQLPEPMATASAAIFAGLGLMSGSVATAALLALVVAGLVNLLVRYGRLHYRLLQPAAQG